MDIQEYMFAEAAQGSVSDNAEFELPYEPLMHDLIGLPSEQSRHIVARAALLNELRADERLNEVLHAISVKTGIQALRQAAIQAKHDLARKVGVDLSLALTTSAWPKIQSKRKRDDVVKTGSKFIERFEEFSRELEKRGPDISRRLLQLTRDEWKLPYAWLPAELVFHFLNGELNFVYGKASTFIYRLSDTTITKPISIPAGTTTRSAIAALEGILDSLKKQPKPRRTQKSDDEIVQRNARWLYRAKIKCESIVSLGWEYHESVHPEKVGCMGDRSTVQSGIKEVDRLLRLTRYRIPAPPAENSH